MSLNVELLEQSFERIKPCADEFVASFYENLFAAHPEVRPLFATTEMQKQRKMLLNALVLVVQNLRNPEVLGQVLNSLGARHVGYGAIPKYYPAVGQALLLSFEQYLQDDWTPELKKAWTDAYGTITAQMLKGAGIVDTAEDRSPAETPDRPTATPAAVQTNPSVPDIAAKTEVEEIPALAVSELPVELLERSFEKIKPHAQEFVASFYEKLFQAHPELKPMFAHLEMAQQQKKLFNALVLVVENLRNPSALGPVLSALGGRHVGYGTLPKQYPAVGKALLLTFEEYLQDDWTPEVKKAWTDAYGTITAKMLQGAAQQRQVTQAQKTETSEKAAVSEASTKSKTESKTGFEQQFKEFQAKASNQQWNTFPDRVLKRSIQAFWAAPVWLVAVIAAVSWSGFFVIAEENPQLKKVLEGADTTSLIVALVIFIKEAPDRRKQFHYQAWSTIDAAHEVKVSYARIMALQDLNKDGVPLRGLDAPGAELTEIQLPKANLSNANLTAADLSNADLSDTNLNQANLHQTKLSGVNFSGANLSFAKLSRANLSSANLSTTNLICADLSHANLSGANLRNANLSGANLAEAYLTGANLKGAQVGTSELSAAFLEGAIMPDGSKYSNRQAG